MKKLKWENFKIFFPRLQSSLSDASSKIIGFYGKHGNECPQMEGAYEAGDCLAMEKRVTQNFPGQSSSGVQFPKAWS